MAAAAGLNSDGFDDLAKALQDAAKNAIPEFTMGTFGGCYWCCTIFRTSRYMLLKMI